jgi:predicted metalloendopeptidase
MNRFVMTLVTASLTACAATTESPAPTTPDTPEVKLGTGLDTAGFDRALRPQDDLFRFVNGKWLETTEIPADRSNYGAFVALDDQAQADLRAIVEEAANAKGHAAGSDAQKIGDFYLSYMDEPRANARGLEPLASELGRIDALTDRKALTHYFGYAQQVGVSHPIWL